MTTRSIVCADGTAHLYRQQPLSSDELATLEAKIATVIRRHYPDALDLQVELSASVWIPTTTAGSLTTSRKQEASPCQDDKAAPTTSVNSPSQNSKPQNPILTTSIPST